MRAKEIPKDLPLVLPVQGVIEPVNLLIKDKNNAYVDIETTESRYEHEQASQVHAAIVPQSTPKPRAVVKSYPPIRSGASHGNVRTLAYQMTVAAFGESEWAAMDAIIERESGYNPYARNPSSGACGIPQALPCSKMPDQSPQGQISWMIGYIHNRYGTPSNALAWHIHHNWY